MHVWKELWSPLKVLGLDLFEAGDELADRLVELNLVQLAQALRLALGGGILNELQVDDPLRCAPRLR